MMEMTVANWQKYIKPIAILLILVFLGAGIFLYTEHQKKQTVLKASNLYENILLKIRKKEFKKVSEDASLLVQQYPNTPYAALASMILAKIAIERHEIPTAVEHFDFVIKNSTDSPLNHIARVRLARVLLNEEQYDEALKALQNKNIPEGYTTLYEETKGDIYLKQNNIEKAKEAYFTAIKAAPNGVPTTSLQLKQSDLENEEEI